MRRFIIVTVITLLSATPRHPVIDHHHGVAVADDYRWLENENDPKVKEWVAAQNANTRALLDAIPSRAAIADRLRELYTTRPASYRNLVQRGGRLFALKNEPPKEQSMLVTFSSIDDRASERVLLDPATLASDGSIAIDFFTPSLDGRFVAVSLSRGGSEEGTLHVYDAATGRELGDTIARVNGGTAGGSVAWNSDMTGFYYTRYPRDGERASADRDFYQEIYFHRLGTSPNDDRYEVGKEFPRIAESTLESSDDGRWLLATVLNGDGGEAAHYLRSDDGTWKQITSFIDRVPFARLGFDGNVYLLSRKDSPLGAIIRMPLTNPDLASAKTIVPAGKTSIEWFVTTPHHLFINALDGGPSQLRMHSLDGTLETVVDTLPVSAVDELVRLDGDAVIFSNGSYLQRPSWFAFDCAAMKARPIAINVPSPVSFDDCEIERVMVTSKDGTKVPLNILKRKGTTLDGSHPALLTGYGGYSVNQTPHFSERRRLWLDAGGIFVEANLRGGAEYGESWHAQGKLTKKQNVFDDFAACAQYLVDHHYTKPSKLVIEGWSNGGLLMGAALTQHPELFRVVIAHVGVFDILRAELSPNGAFNVTEYGTVKNRAQFKAMHAYSPYHRVTNGTAYPSVFMLTGDNDPRVDPLQSRKMTARLQAATSSSHPILLRTSSSSGHGMGTALSERISEDADIWSFVFHELGLR